MPQSTEASRRHVAWRIESREVAVRRLCESGRDVSGAAAPGEHVALLVAYGASDKPRALTWVPYRESAQPHLQREAHVLNRFDAWLESNGDADVWALATAWHFYREWVAGGDVPHWQSCLRKRFPAQPLLDEVVAVSRGWVLWDFQVDLVCALAADNAVQASRLAAAWRLQYADTQSGAPEGTLPDRSTLGDVCRNRARRSRSGSVLTFGAPDLRLAWALHDLLQQPGLPRNR